MWSFCPVAIPASITDGTPASTTTMSTGLRVRSALTSAATPVSSILMLSTSSLSGSSLSTGVIASQATSISPSSSGTATVPASPSNTAGTSLGQSLPSISILPNTTNEPPLVSVGPYICSSTINLSTFTSQFLDYIQKTENSIGAHLLYATLNIHAAAEDSSPLAPAPKPSILPEQSDLLGALFSANLSAYLYTPSDLMSDRANINGSWYTVPEKYRPVQDFYATQVDQHGIASTQDGWPSEGYIEWAQSKRLLLGFGTVDPQMSGYNLTGDYSTIFPSGYIQNNQPDTNASSSGQVTQGCFLRNNTAELSLVNSSWATGTGISGFDYPTSPSSDLLPLLSLMSNFTNCGISPILNVTLLNSTADDNFAPYQNYSYATIWSWAPGEPKYKSSNNGSADPIFRCAFATTDLGGRWIVNECSSEFYASCRANTQPYNWTVTTDPVAYSYANQACPDGYTFAAPRTALENSYLVQAIGSVQSDYDANGVWVDFNSLDTEGCWVSGGPNATCPYLNTSSVQNDLKERYIIVRGSSSEEWTHA
jgi:hypothetical protein